MELREEIACLMSLARDSLPRSTMPLWAVRAVSVSLHMSSRCSRYLSCIADRACVAYVSTESSLRGRERRAPAGNQSNCSS